MQEKIRSWADNFLKYRLEAEKHPRALEARASQILTWPVRATIYPRVELKTSPSNTIGKLHQTRIIPNKDILMTLYLEK